MRKGTLARVEIYVGLAVIAAIFVLAGYGLVSALADRLDPKLHACVVRNTQIGLDDGQRMTKDVAVALCKRLEADGAL